MTDRATLTRAVGRPLPRVEAREKVTGAARYAYEHGGEEVAYAWIVGASIARGHVRGVDDRPALEAPGVIAVLWHENAPRLQEGDDRELAVLQSPEVSYRGQIIAAVVADTLENAREASALVGVDYETERHDVVLRPDHPALYQPETVTGVPPSAADTAHGHFEGAFRDAAVKIDATYETPAFHNNAMEPHATTAAWERDESLTIYDSTQGAPSTSAAVAAVFGLEPGQVRVIAPHVGGGFGSKGTPRPNVVLAALAAKVTGRPVKLAVTRQQMFQLTGYRTPTIQRLRLGADQDGRLVAISHDVVEQTSTVREFAEQTADPTRMMYAAPNRRTTHRLVRLDVPANSWMRAPGECPGMYGLESAMDELAVASGIDPIELRARNEPPVDPEAGTPFSSRNLLACLREGAERFGWAERDPAAGARRHGRWLLARGWPRPPTRPGAHPRRRSLARAATAVSPSRSAPPTSVPVRAPCSPRSPPTRSVSTPTWSGSRSATARCPPAQSPAAPPAPPPGGRPCSGRARRCAATAARSRPTTPAKTSRARRTTLVTRSAPSSRRSASTSTVERSGSSACSASLPPAASSTRAPRARSSSAA